jgi:hypothetical protein
VRASRVKVVLSMYMYMYMYVQIETSNTPPFVFLRSTDKFKLRIDQLSSK